MGHTSDTAHLGNAADVSRETRGVSIAKLETWKGRIYGAVGED